MAQPIPNTVRNPDGTLTWSHPHGSVEYREAPSGTFYHSQTCPQVVALLEKARSERHIVRLYYGDASTGKDWLEEQDVRGVVSRSVGRLKVPILVEPGKDGGAPLLDHCIVRMQVLGRDVYRHPHYHQGEISARSSEHADLPYAVFVDGKNHANFKTEKQRARYLSYITGAPAPALGLVR